MHWLPILALAEEALAEAVQVEAIQVEAIQAEVHGLPTLAFGAEGTMTEGITMADIFRFITEVRTGGVGTHGFIRSVIIPTTRIHTTLIMHRRLCLQTQRNT